MNKRLFNDQKNAIIIRNKKVRKAQNLFFVMGGL